MGRAAVEAYISEAAEGAKNDPTLCFLPLAVVMLAPAAWADMYETPVPAPPPPYPAPLQTLAGPAAPNLARIYVYRDNGDYQNLEWI